MKLTDNTLFPPGKTVAFRPSPENLKFLNETAARSGVNEKSLIVNELLYAAKHPVNTDSNNATSANESANNEELQRLQADYELVSAQFNELKTAFAELQTVNEHLQTEVNATSQSMANAMENLILEMLQGLGLSESQIAAVKSGDLQAAFGISHDELNSIIEGKQALVAAEELTQLKTAAAKTSGIHLKPGECIIGFTVEQAQQLAKLKAAFIKMGHQYPNNNPAPVIHDAITIANNSIESAVTMLKPFKSLL